MTTYDHKEGALKPKLPARSAERMANKQKNTWQAQREAAQRPGPGPEPGRPPPRGQRLGPRTSRARFFPGLFSSLLLLGFWGALLGALLVSLGACEEEKILPGERLPLEGFQEGQIDTPENVSGTILQDLYPLPEPVTPRVWSQFHYAASNHIPHLGWNPGPEPAGTPGGAFEPWWLWERPKSVRLSGFNFNHRWQQAAPVLSDRTVFLFDEAGEVRALDRETHREKWRHAVADYGPDPYGRTGFGGMMALDNSRLYVADGLGFISALSLEDGALIWRVNPVEEPLRGGVTLAQNRLYIQTARNRLVTLDADTGALVWSHEAGESNVRFAGVPSPAYANEVLVAGYASGELVAYNAFSGAILWEQNLFTARRIDTISRIGGVQAPIVIADGVVYAAGFSGKLSAFRLLDGEKLWESEITTLQGVTLGGTLLYAIGQDAILYCLSAETGALLWRTALPTHDDDREDGRRQRLSWFRPLLIDSRVLVLSNFGQIAVLDAYEGSVSYRGVTRRAPMGPEPIFAAEGLYVTDATGFFNLYR